MYIAANQVTMRTQLGWICCLLCFTACQSRNKKNDAVTDPSQKQTAMQHPSNWLPQASIYEVNIRQYTPEGSFAAFQQHLPRLQQMGVKVIWLMPIHPIGLKNRKETLGSYYSIKDYKAVNPEFGQLEDFKKLVKEAHRLGLKLIIDWVANHTSWDHNWVQNNPGFYAKNDKGAMYAPFDWADVVQLDHKSTDQQTAMIDAMKFWVAECGIDGFRCDMAHLAPVDFWVRARKELDAVRPLFWLAETQDRPLFKAFDLIYAWEWLHKMEDYVKGKAKLADLQKQVEVYNEDFAQNKFRILFTTNHDENSWNGTEFERYGEAARVFAALSATLPGLPLVYSGQEEPLRKRLSFFNKDTIGLGKYEWAPFFQSLLRLRETNPAVAADSSVAFEWVPNSAADRVFSFRRKKAGREVLVLANLSGTPLTCSVSQEITGLYKNVFSGSPNDFTHEKSFLFNAWDFVIYEK
jgi:alpha-amylase